MYIYMYIYIHIHIYALTYTHAQYIAATPTVDVAYRYSCRR